MKISNSKIHFFNPGHESAVRIDNPHYTPPASVCSMMADLALLPAWYCSSREGEELDNPLIEQQRHSREGGNPLIINHYVITNEANEASRFLSSLPPEIRPTITPVESTHIPLWRGQGEVLEAAPWGLSPHSIRFFESLRSHDVNIVVPEWKDIYKNLTGRQTALRCLSKIRSLLPADFASIVLPRFCSTSAEIRQFISEYPPPYILKTPFSCSGRGIFRLQTRDFDLQTSRWIEGSLKKQGLVSIEPLLNKVRDFAMEFYADGAGNIRFEGLAVFNTWSDGSYSGNLLGNRDWLENHITRYIPVDQLRLIQQQVTVVLSEVFGRDYRGYLGVDMLVYRNDNNFAVHPFVEINVRYTMGLVALQLSRHLIHPASHGQIIIDFNKEKNKTHDKHLQMQEKFPLQLSGDKIRSGYLSLCPVTKDTQYHAYLLIEN